MKRRNRPDFIIPQVNNVYHETESIAILYQRFEILFVMLLK